MISIESRNSLHVSIIGLTESSITLERPTDSMAMTLVPFLRGDSAQWITMTQVEYDALPVKNSQTFYLIVD